jgi:Fe-S-cluster containining protein
MKNGDALATEIHDPEACYLCLLDAPPILSDCRCAMCCRALIIETTLEDAAREPLIAVRGSPIHVPPELTGTGQPEVEGYLLNGPNGCVFLDQMSNRCTIYETRPLCCRRFDCRSYCAVGTEGPHT